MTLGSLNAVVCPRLFSTLEKRSGEANAVPCMR